MTQVKYLSPNYLAPSMNAALLSAAYFLIVAVTSASDKPVGCRPRLEANAEASKGQASGVQTRGYTGLEGCCTVHLLFVLDQRMQRQVRVKHQAYRGYTGVGGCCTCCAYSAIVSLPAVGGGEPL